MSISTKHTICGYCSTGCNLTIEKTDDNEKIKGDKKYSVNQGKACPKGLNIIQPYLSSDRGVTPLIRDNNGQMKPCDWNTALVKMSDQFKRILNEFGSESVAFISTGQIPTEEMAFLGALTKFGMGILDGDGNTRQCMATSVVAYKQSFGFDAPPYTYKDFEESDVLIFIGSNPVVAHPIMWSRVRNNKNNPKIIVIDPRETKTAKLATEHLAIAPKSDLIMLYGIANELIKRGWIDEEYIYKNTNGFEEFREQIKDVTLEDVSIKTKLSIEVIDGLIRTIHEGKKVSFWWTMGVNQSHAGVQTAQAIINIALMTGNIGRPGTGANSITGQCNAMGSRLFSNTTSLFGGRDFTNPKHRSEIAKLLEIDENIIPKRPSIPYNEIIERIKSGKIKGLWIIATNPIHSWTDLNNFKQTMKNLEFLVVQDIYPNTKTAKYADIYLAAAGSCEKDGTFINSERRIGHVSKIIEPPGDALSDFEIFSRLAKVWGCGDMFKKWQKPSDVFEILKKCSIDQPCDFSGIKNYAMLDRMGGIQWPYTDGLNLEVNERRLFENGKYYHADGKAKFIASNIEQNPERTCNKYPLILLTGRGSVCQWHTETRTSKITKLLKMYPNEAYVDINPIDAEKLGVKSEEYVWIMSRCGSVRALAIVNKSVTSGHIFMPMHYSTINELTPPIFDPKSKEPAYKLVAVNVMHETFFMKMFHPHADGKSYYEQGCDNTLCSGCSKVE